MSALIPAPKTNEVIQYFGTPGLKDTRAFSPLGKKKVELKNSMKALLSKEPAQAHTGLAIIYIYENQYELALNEFKLAYEKSNFSKNETIHYANALFIYGDLNQAVQIYLSLIRNNRNDEGLFVQVIKRFSDFCFSKELEDALQTSYVAKNMPANSQVDLKSYAEIFEFLNKFNIPLDFYRKIRNALDQILYKYFSLPTTADYLVHFDLDNLSYVVYPDGLEGLDDPVSVVCQMNDDLQEMMIDIFEENEIQLGSDLDKITAYFSLS